MEALSAVGITDDRSKRALTEGTWRLVYSTNFQASQPPGGPKLGQVYQRITETYEGRSASFPPSAPLSNILVDFFSFRLTSSSLLYLLGSSSAVDNIVEVDLPVLSTVRLTLSHSLKVMKK